MAKMTRSKRLILLTFLSAFCIGKVLGADDPSDDAAVKLQRTGDQKFCTSNVKQIKTNQRTGFFCVAWGTGFPIMTATYDGRELPAIVGGRIPQKKGKPGIGGRLVALAHDAMLDYEPGLNSGDSQREKLFSNILRYASTDNKKKALMLWGCHERPNTYKTLKNHFEAVDKDYMSPSNSRIGRNLTDYTAVVILGEFSKDIVPALTEYVQNGGGIVQAATNWWYGVRLRGNMANWAPRQIMEMAGLKFRANPFFHTQIGNEKTMLSADGVFEGNCEQRTPGEYV